MPPPCASGQHAEEKGYHGYGASKVLMRGNLRCSLTLLPKKDSRVGKPGLDCFDVGKKRRVGRTAGAVAKPEGFAIGDEAEESLLIRSFPNERFVVRVAHLATDDESPADADVRRQPTDLLGRLHAPPSRLD